MAEAEQSGWPRRQLAEPVLLGTATVLFGLLTRYHWQQVCDDAFIAFRYANNLGAGLGPVWNRGEAVEGHGGHGRRDGRVAQFRPGNGRI